MGKNKIITRKRFISRQNYVIHSKRNVLVEHVEYIQNEINEIITKKFENVLTN